MIIGREIAKRGNVMLIMIVTNKRTERREKSVSHQMGVQQAMILIQTLLFKAHTYYIDAYCIILIHSLKMLE